MFCGVSAKTVEHGHRHADRRIRLRDRDDVARLELKGVALRQDAGQLREVEIAVAIG